MPHIQLDNRALLQKVALVDDFVEFRDTELVLAADVPVSDIDALAFRYYIDYANAQDSELLEPALKDIGDEFPEITVSEISEGSGSLQGRGFMVKFEPRVLYYKSGESKVVRTKAKIARKLGMMIEKAMWNGFTNSDTVTSDGAEFDSFFSDVGIEGGYNDETGGGMITLNSTTGNKWDDGGNILRQLRKVATLMMGQNLIQGTQGYEKTLNPATSVMVMDSITYGILYDELLASDYDVVTVGINRIQVPALFGMTFGVANYAVTQSALTVCDNATQYGHAIIYDRAQMPVHCYQSLPPLEGYTRSGIEDAGAVDVLIRDDYDKDGNLEIRFQLFYAVVMEDPKGIIFWGGLRSS